MRAQYTIVEDVTNEQMVDAIVEAISNDGELPLTLVVLDEVQQYIGSNTQRAFDVQEVVETCSSASALKSKLLFVATGQSALTGMANLQRLMGRFQVPVQLEDTDVDKVIRKVVLQKKESAKSEVQIVINQNLGEISRHLRGSTIEHQRDDEKWMVPDYPLLPVRRRFWERILPALDKTGTGSQLRNQLRVVHEALKETANKSLGYVVPADFLYDQIASDLTRTSAISQDIYETISRKRYGNEEEKLQGRLLALILLISKLPSDMEYGIYPTVDTLADLLLEDLNNDKHKLRPIVPKMLQILENEHLVMSRDSEDGRREYSLQTVESQAWYEELHRQENDLLGNVATLESYRSKEIQSYIRKQVAQARITQGEVAESRIITASFDAELPADSDKRIYAWAPEQTEKQFNDLSRGDDQDHATIYIFVPTSYRSELQQAIVGLKAAENTLEIRGGATTEAGKAAKEAMETRLKTAEKNKKKILDEIFSGIQVRLAGGQEVDGDSLAEQIQNAGEIACQRLYHKFKMSDDRGWAKVYDHASRLADPNALEKIGYAGDADKQPVCAEIYRFIGTMKTGKEIRDNFKEAPYGWGNDVIDGALYAMLAAGAIKAANMQEKAVDAKSLDRSALTQTKFRPEKATLSKVQLIKVRGVITALHEEPCNAGEESTKLPLAILNAKNVANQAGGAAPLPMAPSTALLSELEMYSGNDQLLKVFENQEALKSDFEAWKLLADKASSRMKQWHKLQSVIKYCAGLTVRASIEKETAAIMANRSLLDDPNPLDNLLKSAGNALRDALTSHRENYEAEHRHCMADLLDDENWQKLDEAKRNAFLAKRHLDTIPAIEISTLDDTLNSLDTISLDQWNDKTASLPSIFSLVLKDAISELQPKTRYHKLNKPIISNEQELQKWLDYVETELRAQLALGPVVPN